MRTVYLVLVVVLVGAACAKSSPPIQNAASAQCGGMVWPTKLDKPSTPASHREVAMRLLEASGVRAGYAQMLEISLTSILKTNPALAKFEDAFREFFAKYASYDAIAPDFAELYMSVFTELQLRQIEAFYLTPTGRAAVTELPRIIQEGGKIGERKVQEHQQELMDMLMKSQQGGAAPTIAPP